MARTYKVLAALLSYPTEEIQDAATELRSALAVEALVPHPQRSALDRLVDELATGDLFDLQERYVLLFDRTRSLSLHMFEHVHGESRDRGQALVELMQLYASRGLELDTRELPDYLPLFLEFLALLPEGEAREHLSQPLHILAALGERLRQRESGYAAVFDALVAMAGIRPEAEEVEAVLAEPDDDPGDLEALDRVWAEDPVQFGPGIDDGDSGCPRAADILERMAAPDMAGRSDSGARQGV